MVSTKSTSGSAGTGQHGRFGKTGSQPLDRDWECPSLDRRKRGLRQAAPPRIETVQICFQPFREYFNEMLHAAPASSHW